MQPTMYMGPEGVCVTIHPRGFARGRLPDRPNFSAKIGCCDGVWGGGWFQDCFSTAYRYRKDEQMHGSKCIGQQWVHATLNTSDVRCGRLLEHSNFIAKIGCSDGVWGGGWFQDCFSVAYGYGKDEQMHGSKCIGQQWVHATLNTSDLTLARLQEPSKLSNKRGVVSEYGVKVGSKMVFLLPMGMDRKG